MLRFQEGGILGHVVDRQQDLGVELVAGNQVGYVGLVVPLTGVAPALRVEGLSYHDRTGVCYCQPL